MDDDMRVTCNRDHFRDDLMRRQLTDSADVYAEVYSDDGETKEWTATELSKWSE